jgi:spoIIIJ-associated protein
MEWVQTTGRTVDAALEAALDELGVHQEDVEFEVLDEPKAGLFGRFGSSEARIRVRLKPISREKPQDRRRGKSKGGGGRRSEGSAKRPRSNSQPKPKQPQPQPRNEGARTVDESNVSVEDQAAAAEEFVSGLVEAIGLEGDVTSTVDDDIIEIHVDGSELGLLVGPKGATLTAMEELTRAVVQREAGGNSARVRVDVAGYRAKRRVALAAFTESIVAEVLESGEARALEPMNSLDRKTVHDTVNEIDGVETVSEGEDARRHVVIRPA